MTVSFDMIILVSLQLTIQGMSVGLVTIIGASILAIITPTGLPNKRKIQCIIYIHLYKHHKPRKGGIEVKMEHGSENNTMYFVKQKHLPCTMEMVSSPKPSHNLAFGICNGSSKLLKCSKIHGLYDIH